MGYGYYITMIGLSWSLLQSCTPFDVSVDVEVYGNKGSKWATRGLGQCRPING